MFSSAEILAAGPGDAQAPTIPTGPTFDLRLDTEHPVWVTLGAGIGRPGTWGGVMGVSLQAGPHLLSLRGAVAFELFGTAAWDVSVLYGRSTRYAQFHTSAAVGVGLVGGSRQVGDGGLFGRREPLPWVPGIALELQAFVEQSGKTAVGLVAFGNFNSQQPFAGLALALEFGRLR
ncbi:MAG: hypothetical protein IH965_05465 [Gemmatimonadetes bacterium]|nr:hypothetical protein [Gemmatimonadota bacterium]